MKKCLNCECIYPDYHEKCPVCGNQEKKEWLRSDVQKKKDQGLIESAIEENDREIIDYESIGGEDSYS